MKRTLITVDGNGELSIPSNLQDLWMSEGELVEMLYVTAPKLNTVIRSIYRDGLFPVSEGQQRREISKGIWQTMYGLYGAQNEAYMSRSAEKWVRGLCFNELGVGG